uniref:Uncharacterized protein n=1 Tax=Melopsittacus undulatus TaxID=13146 RepID=A0A8V5GPS3_MELUD
MVHWDVLEDCLVGSKGERGRDEGRPGKGGGGEEGDQSVTTKSPTLDVDTPHGASSVLEPRESSVGLKDPGTALLVPKQQAGIPSDERRDERTRVMVQTVPQVVQTASLGTQPREPESTGTQTTSLGTQPREPESTGTQTTSLGTQPREPESTGTQTTSLGTQPGEPESTGTQTTSLETHLETQPGEPESTGTQTTSLETRPGEPESTGTQTTSLETRPGEPESTGTQTTILETRPGEPESTGTQTTSLETRPGEPESTGPGVIPAGLVQGAAGHGQGPAEREGEGKESPREMQGCWESWARRRQLKSPCAGMPQGPCPDSAPTAVPRSGSWRVPLANWRQPEPAGKWI